jgi:hypothetical protein
VFLMCDLELPFLNPALDTLKFSRSVLHSLKINDGGAPYCNPHLTPVTTHVVTIHSILSPDLSVPYNGSFSKGTTIKGNCVCMSDAKYILQLDGSLY